MEEAGRFEKSRMLPAMVMKPPGVTYSTFVGTNTSCAVVLMWMFVNDGSMVAILAHR